MPMKTLGSQEKIVESLKPCSLKLVCVSFSRFIRTPRAFEGHEMEANEKPAEAFNRP